MPFTIQQAGVGGLAHPVYVGESIDPRPLPSGENATLFETDSRRTFVWRNGHWNLWNEPVAAQEVSPNLLAELLTEMKALRLGMILAGTCKEI